MSLTANSGDFREARRALAARWQREQQRLDAEEPGGSSGRNEASEAVVRQMVVDPLLMALNWRLGCDPDVDYPNVRIEEPIRGASGQGSPAPQTTRFMDYVGHDEFGSRALLIVEAKRPRHGVPATAARTLAKYLSRGMSDAKFRQGNWCAVRQLGEYVQQVTQTQGRPPERACLTNGEWLVLFLDPGAAFPLEGAPLTDQETLTNQIRVFRNLTAPDEQAEVDDDELFRLLEYHRVASHAPDLTPSSVATWLGAGGSGRASYAGRVCCNREASGVATRSDGLVSTRVCAGLLIETKGGAWVRVWDDASEIHLRARTTADPADYDATRGALDSLGQRALALKQSVEQTIGQNLECVPLVDIYGQVQGVEHFERAIRAREGRDDPLWVATGDRLELWAPTRGCGGCIHHRHTGAQNSPDGDMSTPSGRIDQSRWRDPRSLFTDGEVFHCAHRRVAESKRQPPAATAGGPSAPARCRLLGADEMLCCECCAYLNVCWGDGRCPNRRDAVQP